MPWYAGNSGNEIRGAGAASDLALAAGTMTAGSGVNVGIAWPLLCTNRPKSKASVCESRSA
ncbi:MAG: hypothetical protein HC852_16310 [Acaryochloridaceae cyanobacterium RU_4_10]|nr:hypothetical protein [Acaryochloridaceae cyanobacterium RU_4_10]